MSEFVRVEILDRVGVIHLDRPKMNALNRQMQDEIGAAARELDGNEEIRCVVVYGGERTFAAGADIKEMAKWDSAEAKRQAGPLQAGFTAVAQIQVPTIAAITGYALGGGCELALCCDLRIAAQDAVLGQPEILLGLIPGAGGTQRLARLIGPSRAKDLILTGRWVKADEALAIGLINEVAPDPYGHALALAKQLATGPRHGMIAAKAAIDRGLEGSLAEGLALEMQLFADRFGTGEAQIGMASFIANGPGKAVF